VRNRLKYRAEPAVAGVRFNHWTPVHGLGEVRQRNRRIEHVDVGLVSERCRDPLLQYRQQVGIPQQERRQRKRLGCHLHPAAEAPVVPLGGAAHEHRPHAPFQAWQPLEQLERQLVLHLRVIRPDGAHVAIREQRDAAHVVDLAERGDDQVHPAWPEHRVDRVRLQRVDVQRDSGRLAAEPLQHRLQQHDHGIVAHGD
jgi:hypothetical protein